jgi:hypothetical protein
VVVTLHHREESRGAAMRRQQERHRPAQRVQIPPSMAPAAARKRESKCAPEKPLPLSQDPSSQRAGAGGPVGVTPEPTPQKWCPLPETSLHDVRACHYIRHLVEIRRECLAKHAAEGVTHDSYECG